MKCLYRKGAELKAVTQPAQQNSATIIGNLLRSKGPAPTAACGRLWLCPASPCDECVDLYIWASWVVLWLYLHLAQLMSCQHARRGAVDCYRAQSLIVPYIEMGAAAVRGLN